ncbi:MAG: lipoprotein [Proteobacteria bacterium]|nr:lipoprotein [Pseudomonadota bacterium]
MTASRPDLFPTRRAALRLAAVGLVLGLAACGKRGPLEPPPGSADAAKSQKSQDDQQGIPGLKGAKKRPPPVTPPKRDFFLDFLL